MSRLSNLSKQLLVLFFLGFLSACANKDWIASPGRVKPDEPLKDYFARVETSCEKLPFCKEGKLEIVGHQAASYRTFPMRVEKEGEEGYIRGNVWSKRCPPKAENIKTLMDRAFTSGHIDSIEIDVHTPPPSESETVCAPGEECFFIIHDEPDWKLLANHQHKAWDHFNKNRFSEVLKYFNDTYYHTHGLYIELKAERECQRPDQKNQEKRVLNNGRVCGEAGRKVGQAVAKYVTKLNNKSAASSRRQPFKRGKKGPQAPITFVSFSAKELEGAHAALGKNNQVSYALIAGVAPTFFSPIIYTAGQAKGPVPMFDEEFMSFAERAEWLDLIWFSPQGVPDFWERFQKINKVRQCKLKSKKTLKLSVSNYQYDYERFLEKMSYLLPDNLGEPENLTEIVAMMIDVDRDKEKASCIKKPELK